VTIRQKRAVLKKMIESGYKRESEYVLACCLRGCDEKIISEYKEWQLNNSNLGRLEARITEKDKKEILARFEKSKINNFSRFIRNCCLDNPIIVIDNLKELSNELHKVGNNLNQLTMLCHQGMVVAPDISESTELLKRIYKEITEINLRNRLKR